MERFEIYGEWGLPARWEMAQPLIATLPCRCSISQPGGAINGPKQVSCMATPHGVALLTSSGNGLDPGALAAHGELVNGTTGFSYTPVQVTGLSNILSISSGWKHTLALKTDGTVYSVEGFNSHGELGDGTANNQSNAVRVLNISNTRRRFRRRL